MTKDVILSTVQNSLTLSAASRLAITLFGATARCRSLNGERQVLINEQVIAFGRSFEEALDRAKWLRKNRSKR